MQLAIERLETEVPSAFSDGLRISMDSADISDLTPLLACL